MGNGYKDPLDRDEMGEAVLSLEKIIDICKTYKDGKSSWSQVCRQENIDPERARRVLLHARKCRSKYPLFLNEPRQMYDGFELFYRDVFGEKQADGCHFAPDYQETVLFVVNNTDLSVTEKQVLTLYYGLNGDESQTLEEIGRDFGVTRSWIDTVKKKALQHCRMQPRLDMLRMGLEEYEREADHQKELRYLRSQQKVKEYEARMAVLRLQLSENTAGDSKGTAARLKDVDIFVLRLPVRARNALLRADCRNLLDLLDYNGGNGWRKLSKLRNIGIQTIEDIKTAVDTYLEDHYDLSSDEMYGICFGPGR